MLLQGGLPVDSQTVPEQLAVVKGKDLMGTPLSVRNLHMKCACS